MFTVGFVSGSHDFMLYFHFWWTAHATFDKKKILIHSADVGWEGYVCECVSLTHKASNSHGCEAHCNRRFKN